MYCRRNSDDVSDISSLHLNQEPSTYIPVKVLGKGAFGEAKLYRKVDDQCLVVWKEVFLQRLDEVKKQEARNEVDVLAVLDHPNVIAYYNHFLDENSLFIEMEYANGGSLYHRLGRSSNLLDEKEVVWLFYQIISGLNHIHELNILHRDIKTLNIFLTKTGVVKLGDFGIAKMLEAGGMAETCVGTPYYMSPEIIKGKPYSFHSDMWATGCVLYEMLTLKRTFDASNPLRLAAYIVDGRYDDVSDQYSNLIKQVLNSLLQQEPDDRPTTTELLKHPLLNEEHLNICQQINEICQMEGYRRPLSSESSRFPIVVSKSTEVYQWGAGKLQPQKVTCFEQDTAATSVAVGNHHMAVITIEKELYTWTVSQGHNRVSGELGHGDLATYRLPKIVNSLVGLPLKQVACGDDFTMCSTDDGRLFTFGSDYYGCLGVGRSAGDKILLPVEVNFFHRGGHRVHRISCGDCHCVVLTQDFEIYTWGCGEFGRLGLGSEDDFDSPQGVHLQSLLMGLRNYRPCEIIAGVDGTFFISENGKVFACGNNEHNKLGFNNAAVGISRAHYSLSYDIPCELNFGLVKPLSRYRIRTIAAGKTHTGVIDEFDKLYLFGSNRYGQLGCGDYKACLGIQKVSRTLTGKKFNSIACGDGFTVACTKDKEVYSWGLATDGRLGYGVECNNRNSSNLPPSCQATPRAIFGIMHDVTDLAARSWHVLMIAERLLNTRVVTPKPGSYRSSPVNSPLRAPSTISNFTSQHQSLSQLSKGFPLSSINKSHELSINNQANNADEQNDSLNQSFTPDWLKDEYDNAEIIPLHSEDNSSLAGVAGVVVGDGLDELINDDDKTALPLRNSPNIECGSALCKQEKEELKARIKMLEEENINLVRRLSNYGHH